MAAHLFGYVSEVTEAQLQRAGIPGRRAGHDGRTGWHRAGLQQAADGRRRQPRVVVNSLGREIQELDKQDPVEGQRAATHDRRRFAKATEDAFTASASTAPRSCSIRATARCWAFTSRPAYDPNAFAAGIDRATWAPLNTDELKPLQNRALQGRYSPGSTFKMAVGLAGLEEGVITPELPGALFRRRDVLRPPVRVLEEGRARHASICGTRSSSRATCTSTPSATCSASTASTSGRRCSASA